MLPEGKDLKIFDSRHPLIEAINPMGCIANDCVMIKGHSNM